MANFSEDKIKQTWEKGVSVEGYDNTKFRKDVCGAWMQRDKYETEEIHGWKINHIYPVSKGGTDDIVNLRPMHWENDRSKQDDYPSYSCAVKSNGSKNVKSDETRTIYKELQETLKTKYKIK